MLQAGWSVHATDLTPTAFDHLAKNIPSKFSKQLTTQCCSFEDVKWKKVQWVNASYCLPFCEKKVFPNVWQNVVHSLEPGSVFTGHFFGPRDTWKSLMLLGKMKVKQLFKGFYFPLFSETEEDKDPAVGPTKHWHLFEVVAVKK